jgi:hypothetical protein
VLLGLGLTTGLAWTLRQGGRARLARTLLQLAAAVLLAFACFPPQGRVPVARDELVVLTPGATAAQAGDASGAARVALPGVAAPTGTEHAPDLGTALRRHPQAARVVVRGGGLPARDLDAARGRVARFEPAPLPRGLAGLVLPRDVASGARFPLRGRVEGIAGAGVDLRDPAGTVVASATVDAAGRFLLHAVARDAGPALFSLRVSDREGRVVDDVAAPIVARAGAPLRVLLIAAAPDPELKYLRRWIVDAGLALDSRIGLSEGVALGDGPVRLDAAALGATDLAIIDERAWRTLPAGQRDALLAAVDAGLGLLLRVDAAPDPARAGRLAGFTLQPAPDATPVRAFEDAGEGSAFTRAPVAVAAEGAAVALRADDGRPLLLWRAQGEGRVGLDLLQDSWRLVLAGHAARHATFWSSTFATLARPRGGPASTPPIEARVGERAVACGIEGDAAIEAPDGTRTALRVDPATGAARCAAAWPRAAGWHALLAGDMREPFFVRAADSAPALAAAARAQATRALVAATEPSTLELRAAPWPRWPFFLAWLAASAGLWWLERDARTRESAAGEDDHAPLVSATTPGGVPPGDGPDASLR